MAKTDGAMYRTFFTYTKTDWNSSYRVSEQNKSKSYGGFGEHKSIRYSAGRGVIRWGVSSTRLETTSIQREIKWYWYKKS